MQVITDQMGRTIRLRDYPRRIVSLVPSQTELLHALGLEQTVVGITRFCTRPESWRSEKVNVGGTKTPDLDKIRALKPDLILGNKEENSADTIHALENSFPVWMSDISTLGDALDMITRVGNMTGKDLEATRMASEIQDKFSQFSYQTSAIPPVRALYFIWREPWMAAGNNTFIHSMLRQAGFLNVAGHLERYPELPLAAWSDLQPEVVMLSSEPYPFSEKHLAAVQGAFPDSKVTLVDGEMFSWYGSNLLLAPDYFGKLTRVIAAMD